MNKFLSELHNKCRFGPVLNDFFVIKHYLSDGTIKEFELTICKHPDPDGTRYATYKNGVSVVLTGRSFERLVKMHEKTSIYPPTLMPHKLRESFL